MSISSVSASRIRHQLSNFGDFTQTNRVFRCILSLLRQKGGHFQSFLWRKRKLLRAGKKIEYLPAAFEDQLKIKPIYETFEGWKKPTNGIKNIKDLPEKAKKYIYAIENFIGAKISSISTSPEREDTILLENPFDL